MLASGLFVLQGILLLLLLTVCGNTGTSCWRESARQREIGVLFALGASRWQVMRLLRDRA
jgi:ABC-type lipoprotein release transport system permease subunit